MKLTETDALIDELSFIYDIAEDEDNPYNIGVMAAITTIRRMPTIDAVPVVRCKDCRWSTNEPYRGDDVWICNFNQWRRSQGKRKPDFFCADGERREDDA